MLGKKNRKTPAVREKEMGVCVCHLRGKIVEKYKTEKLERKKGEKQKQKK